MSGYANWNPVVTYSINDIVDYDAKIWVSLQNTNLNKQPDISPSWWSQIGGGGVISNIVGGAGITVSGAGSTRTVATNLATADARVSIATGVGTQLVLGTSCPASVLAGAGLASTGTNPTGITLSMPNVGTPNTYAYPTSVTTDAQGRVSAITAGTAPSVPSTVVITSGSGSYVLPGSGTYNVEYTIVGGGGGGGGGGDTTPIQGGGGGGGGGGAGLVSGSFWATAGTSITYSVGAAGAAGVGGAGGTGGTTTFTYGGFTSSFAGSSAGGTGGLYGSTAGAGGGNGAYGGGGGGASNIVLAGAAGSGTIVNGIAGIQYTGGKGGYGASGAGGGSLGGTNTVYGGGGGGGGVGGGVGGSGISGNGANGTSYGSGGGGGAAAGLAVASGGTGGAGANGAVIFTLTPLG